MKNFIFYFAIPVWLGFMAFCFYEIIEASHDAYERNMAVCVNKDKKAYPQDTEAQARFKCEYLYR